MIARLIGEKSAGRTAVEIYDGEQLVWSHMYFADGCTHEGYISGLQQVIDDMINCNDVASYEGCDYDEDGEITLYDDASTTGIILEYNGDDKTWSFGSRYGQSDEIAEALMSLGIIDADEGHADRADDEVVKRLVDYIPQELINDMWEKWS